MRFINAFLFFLCLTIIYSCNPCKSQYNEGYETGKKEGYQQGADDQKLKITLAYEEKYAPNGLRFTEANWEWNEAYPTKFSGFVITLENNTEFDFDKIIYQVLIKTGKDSKIRPYGSKPNYKNEVFKRTFEFNSKIYAGDIRKIYISDLNYYDIGVYVSNQDNFDWDGFIVDAKPKPVGEILK